MMTPTERTNLRKHLVEGLGVEDIALIEGFNPNYVRAEIRHMGRTGELAVIYSSARIMWRAQA